VLPVAPRFVVRTPRHVIGTPRLVIGAPSLVIGAPSLVIGTPRIVVGTPMLLAATSKCAHVHPKLFPALRGVLKLITITSMVLQYQSSEIPVTLNAGWNAL
jgi:hypothetical protein